MKNRQLGWLFTTSLNHNNQILSGSQSFVMTTHIGADCLKKTSSYYYFMIFCMIILNITFFHHQFSPFVHYDIYRPEKGEKGDWLVVVNGPYLPSLYGKMWKFSNLVSLGNVENYIQDYQCNKALSYQYLIILWGS